jgi:hypothetical protein
MLLLLAGREGAVIKLGELVMILELHQQGVSVSAIAATSESIARPCARTLPKA